METQIRVISGNKIGVHMQKRGGKFLTEQPTYNPNDNNVVKTRSSGSNGQCMTYSNNNIAGIFNPYTGTNINNDQMIGSWLSDAGDWVNKQYKSLKNDVQQAIDYFKDKYGDFTKWTSRQWNDFKDWTKGAIESFKLWISNRWKDVKGFAKKAWHFISKINPILIVGRNAYLLVVKYNLFGAAATIRNMIKASKNSVQATWEALGGDFNYLVQAMESGLKRKAVKIGEPISFTAIATAATPVIVAMAALAVELKKLIKDNDNKNDSGQNMDPSDVTPPPNYEDPMLPTKTDDKKKEEDNSLLLIGGAGLLLFMLAKK